MSQLIPINGPEGLDNVARIQCVLHFDLTWEQVKSMPVEHATALPAPVDPDHMIDAIAHEKALGGDV